MPLNDGERVALPGSAISDSMQCAINLTIGWLLETLPPLPARDDTIEAHIDAELERIRLVEATVKRWWRLS